VVLNRILAMATVAPRPGTGGGQRCVSSLDLKGVEREEATDDRGHRVLRSTTTVQHDRI
jgi:hypothetical protein